MRGQELFNKLCDDLGYYDSPRLRPSYILPDGKFLNIPTPKELGVQALIKYQCHALINLWIIYNNYVKGYSLWDMNIVHIMEDNGAIRTNFGILPDPDAKLNYIVLPKNKPSEAQLESLKNLIDFAYTHNVKNVEVNINYGKDSENYNLDEVYSEDIINNIRHYYSTGKLHV